MGCNQHAAVDMSCRTSKVRVLCPCRATNADEMHLISAPGPDKCAAEGVPERAQVQWQIIDRSWATCSACCDSELFNSPARFHDLSVLVLLWACKSLAMLQAYSKLFALFRLATTTCAPAQASAFATSKPIPELPPVTTACFPATSER